MTDNQLNISTPRYQQIAADIAAKIAAKEYKVGDKIYARSSIASQYGVSAETARRAICVLSDLHIVDTEKGSGVIISSYENAVTYIRRFQDVQTINDIKQQMLDSVERQQHEQQIFNRCLEDLIDKTERLRSANPFIPFHITITDATPALNHSIVETNFWHHTAATIIAIKREDTLLLSPGPYALFMEHDIIYFIGDNACPDRVRLFLYPNTDSSYPKAICTK